MRKFSVVAKDAPMPSGVLQLRVEESRSRMQRLADRAGICLSVICIVHCIATPIILVLLPVMQILELWHGSLHVVFAAIIPALALAAFIPGYKLHKEKRVFKIALIGFALIISGITVPHILKIEWLEPVLSICGSVFLVRAHIINRNLCACCRSGHGKH